MQSHKYSDMIWKGRVVYVKFPHSRPTSTIPSRMDLKEVFLFCSLSLQSSVKSTQPLPRNILCWIVDCCFRSEVSYFEQNDVSCSFIICIQKNCSVKVLTCLFCYHFCNFANDDNEWYRSPGYVPFPGDFVWSKKLFVIPYYLIRNKNEVNTFSTDLSLEFDPRTREGWTKYIYIYIYIYIYSKQFR